MKYKFTSITFEVYNSDAEPIGEINLTPDNSTQKKFIKDVKDNAKVLAELEGESPHGLSAYPISINVHREGENDISYPILATHNDPVDYMRDLANQ